MLEFIDYIGLFAFAISGALTAANRNFDILGGYIIAFITAIGGGTFRDLLLNEQAAWMQSASQIIVVGIGATIGIVFSKGLGKWRTALSIFDTIGIAVFTIVGAQKAFDHDQLAFICVLLGMMTATFGGLTRDVLCNEIPLIFKKEIYAIPCLTGGAIYITGSSFGYSEKGWLIWLSFGMIVLFRTLAVRYQWKLPLIASINR